MSARMFDRASAYLPLGGGFHTAEDIAAYIEAFGDYCAMLAGGK